jgi:hypothetical protein
VDVHTVNGDTLVRVRSEIAATELPRLARRLVGRKVFVMQTRIWHPAGPDGAREADVEGGISGVPVWLTGSARIVPEGKSTTEAFDLHVRASVPVIGNRLERVVTDAVAVGLGVKFEVAWSWLAGTI